MKNPGLVFIGAMFLTASVMGQSKKADQTTSERQQDLTERLGVMIENFIDDVTREFSAQTYETPVDTIPTGNQSKSPQANITFNGNKTVEEGETIQANVVVKAGNLTVYGTIDGDVLVVGGTLYVKDGGTIRGNARVINGDIVKDENGVVEGYMDKTSASTAGYRFDRGRFTRSGYRLDANWVDEMTNLDNFIYRYNRVEGHFFGLGSDKKYYWDGYRRFSVYGSVGWGAKSHRWRYNLGIARQFLITSSPSGGGILEIGGEGHSFTDTKDQWIIGTNENTAAAILIHEDFRDYFGREGFSIHTGYYTRFDDVTAQLKVAYVLDKYSSLEKRTEWSVFGGNKVFRPNPAIDDGRMRSFVISPGFSTTTRTSRGPEGWSMYGTAEFADTRYGGNFSFSQTIADIRRYQPLSQYDNFNLRLRVGTSGGKLPAQKIFELGGLSSLHGRPFKSEIGNRMILLNAEYIVNGDFLHELDFWPSGLLRHFNFIVLSDAGLMRNVSREKGWTDGFENIRFSEFKHDIGLGLSNRNGSFRIGFVWRTDIKAPGRLFFRFNRPF